LAQWNLHWLDASGDLSPWRTQIASEIEASRIAVARIVEPPKVDILLQRAAGAVIPEIGMVGHAYRDTLFALTFDPANAHFERCIGDGSLRRQVAHEVHHCCRMSGPGYGQTLGEALVSEGLAGQFCRHLFGTPPEPWEASVDAATLELHWPDIATVSATNYNHTSWFFGAGGIRPRWIGYTLGFNLVGQWIDRDGVPHGNNWFNVSALEVLRTRWPKLQQPSVAD
jgi:hypothetical protein